MRCPRCRLENPPTALRCDCGYDFASRTIKHSYVRSHEAQKAAPVTSGEQSAGLLPRAAALLIDFLICFAVLMVAAILGGFLSDPMGTAERMKPLGDSLVVQLGLTVYFALWESSPWQGTPGKRLLNLKVRGADGESIGFFRAFWRNVAKDVSGCLFPVAIGLIVFTPERRCLHDYLAATWVTRRAS